MPLKNDDEIFMSSHIKDSMYGFDDYNDDNERRRSLSATNTTTTDQINDNGPQTIDCRLLQTNRLHSNRFRYDV